MIFSLGVKKWHAEQHLRKIKANEKLKDGPGCVLLGAKLNVFYKAEKLLTLVVLNLTRCVREEYVKELCDQGVAWAPLAGPHCYRHS